MAAPASVDNVYHAAIQRTGSQWLKAIFSDARIRGASGLAVQPQRRYEWDAFQKSFPPYTYVPGLYISYGAYEEISKPRNYATIYVYRDPRDVVVSWYHSMLESHSPMGKVPAHRRRLRSLSFEEGLAYSIRVLQLKMSFLWSWYLNREDDRVLFVQFEELVERPEEQFSRIFRHCGIDVPSSLLGEVLEDYTKRKMRKRDMQRRSGETSHYREGGSSWEEAFAESHARLFRDLNGRLVEALGYDWSREDQR